MSGSASATPGTSFTSVTNVALIGGRCVSPFALIFDALRTTASVPLFTLVNRSLNVAFRVSPSTIVPARNAMPSTTARDVPTNRRLWAQSDLRLIRNTGYSPSDFMRSSTLSGVGFGS